MLEPQCVDVVSGERRLALAQLVEDHAERVKITAVIDGAVVHRLGSDGRRRAAGQYISAAIVVFANDRRSLVLVCSPDTIRIAS